MRSVKMGAALVVGAAMAAVAPAAAAQDGVNDESASTFAYASKDGIATVDIRNVSYAITGSYLAGRPENERLVLRSSLQTHEVIDEKGMETTLTVQAWPLGASFSVAPAYTVSVPGATGVSPLDNAILLVSRGTEDVTWSSAYSLGSGAHLFDSLPPVVRFSITPDVQTLRYAGLEVPPDDAEDRRLAEPKVVGVISYASGAGVLREALVTCDDEEHAALLRSFWDTRQHLAVRQDGAGEAAPALLVDWFTDAPATVAVGTLVVPVKDDDLDLAAAQLPACIAVESWQR